ncbi:hypothetical protein [Intrasporangium sp.]|uniref:hypothetical protein n=1 Tax=Intrasporangium sp. TaxID=1925024 RepID=UPI0032214676
MAHRPSVLVVFRHALLGEGLAARLKALGIEVTSAEVQDSPTLVTALQDHPDVVVVECADDGCLERVARLSPESRVVDVSASVTRGYTGDTVGFEAILSALPPSAEQPAASRAPPGNVAGRREGTHP